MKPKRNSERETTTTTGPSPEVVRLANRTALLTFTSAFTFVVGVVTFPTAVRDGADLLVRLAAVAPLLAALAAAASLRRTRVRLRAARQQHAAAARVSGPASDEAGPPVREGTRGAARRPAPTRVSPRDTSVRPG